MALKRRGSVFCWLFFAVLFLLMSMIMLSVSLGTDHWQEITFDRAVMAASPPADFTLKPFYFTRYRGMLRTCVPGNETIFFETNPDDLHIVDGICIFDDGIDINNAESRIDAGVGGEDVEIRDHIVRLHLGLFVTSLVTMLIAALIAAFACHTAKSRKMLIAGMFCLVAALFAVCGMGCFHALIYLEDGIEDMVYGFSGYWDVVEPLATLTKVELGYSYILGWTACATIIVACILFTIAGCLSQEPPPPSEKQALHSPPSMPQPMLVSQPPSMMPMAMAAPKPMPVPVPVPMYATYRPRPVPIPAIAYPSGTQTMGYPSGTQSMRQGMMDMYQSQPPAYPGNANFTTRSLAYQ